MSRKKLRRGSERSAESKFHSKIFTLNIPRIVKSAKEKASPREKTSLFVPRKKLITQENGFEPSKFSDKVLISEKTDKVLQKVFKYGDVARRYGEHGLEQDPVRQQIIIYTMIICQNYLLWYQRSSPLDLKRKRGDFIGDPRLQGRYSVGFGGHKTYDDIAYSREELDFLNGVLPAIQVEVGTILGLNRGLFNEVEEEVGLGRKDIKRLSLLGAFHDIRVEDPEVEVQVGWVHTGIAAVLEVDTKATGHLTFRSSEIAKAWWISLKRSKNEYERLNKLWVKGKGPKVETWTEIMIKCFLKKII